MKREKPASNPLHQGFVLKKPKKIWQSNFQLSPAISNSYCIATLPIHLDTITTALTRQKEKRFSSNVDPRRQRNSCGYELLQLNYLLSVFHQLILLCPSPEHHKYLHISIDHYGHKTLRAGLCHDLMPGHFTSKTSNRASEAEYQVDFLWAMSWSIKTTSSAWARE